MELKQRRGQFGYSCKALLIVPYGIETYITLHLTLRLLILLIVPYGIETGDTGRQYSHPVLLLIVPYGIET